MRLLSIEPRRFGVRFATLLLVIAATSLLHGQACMTASDIDDVTKTALVNTAQSYFQMMTAGDSAALKQNAIPILAADFAGIENAVKDNQSNFSGLKAVPRSPFLLQAEGGTSQDRGEFLCGVFGPKGQTSDSAVFQIPNLPAGSYGIVITDVSTTKGPFTVTFVLQKQGSAWMLGGLYVKQAQAAGHDGNWFAERAREFKVKGKNESAWLYYQEAREMLVPVPFMSTMLTDKLYDEAQAIKLTDVAPFNLSASSKTFKVSAIFPLAVGNDLDLVVKYQSDSVANTALTYQDNMAVMKAVLAKYPELREAFDGMIARAVEPSGRDYGSMLTMKDVK
jgi:hypothetical protein